MQPLAAAAILLLAAAGPAAASPSVDRYIGRPIVSVEIDVEGGEAEPALRAMVETRPGRPLSPGEVRESMTHLFSVGRFQDVRVTARLEGDGVALRYTLVPVHSVQRVRFEGDLQVSRRTLSRAVAERYGRTPPVGRAEDVARMLQQLYRDRGYLQARVTPEARAAAAPGRTTLVFRIEPGRRARVGDIQVEGVPPDAVPALLSRLGLRRGESYEPAALQARLDRYVEELRGRGFYEALAGHDPRVREIGQVVDVLLELQPGPRVTVVFEGDALPADVRADLVPVRREGSVDEDLLEDSSRRIAEYLRSQGYWQATAAFRRTRANGELQVVFDVRRGPYYRVADLEIAGNRSVPLAELRPLLGVRPGESFDEAQVDADVEALRNRYRRLGHADVKIDSSIDESAPPEGRRPAGQAGAWVLVRIAIAEGVATRIGDLVLEGAAGVPADELRTRIRSEPGWPYDVLQLIADRDAVLQHYLNQGYQSAAVQVEPRFREGRTLADVHFLIDEGEQTIVDHVLVTGNTRVSTATIERELLLKPGRPLGLQDLAESQRRLAALGLFRRVRITQLVHQSGTRHDVLVSVEEAPATSVGYGAGLEASERLRREAGADGAAVERLEFAPRGFFEAGRRNLWGKNRSVNLFSRVALRRRTVPDGDAERPGPLGFSEYRLLATYREPRAFGWNADMFVTAFFEQAVRSSFSYNRRGVQAELSRALAPGVRLSGRYTYDRTAVFDERFVDKPLIDRLFPRVRLSTLSPAFVRDTRDSREDPASGALLSVDGGLAVRAIGSQVGFGKSLMQGFVYRRVPGARRLVFAGGARLGLAAGFPREVPTADETGAPLRGPDGQPLSDIVRDLPVSERFFAGGHTTVRGFSLDRLGRPETIDPDGFPRGGNALIVLNGELRFPIWRDLGGATFLDAGNVFSRVGDIALEELRAGAGVGIRYRSPIGPIRLDLGFKLDRREIVPGRLESPRALHISIGHAF